MNNFTPLSKQAKAVSAPKAAAPSTTSGTNSAPPTRRQSVRTASLAAAGGEKKDVKDFFQSLLNKYFQKNCHFCILIPYSHTHYSQLYFSIISGLI